MNEKLECVVLRVIPHNERSVVVNCFSRERGRISFISPGGNGKEARRRRALLMPLCVVECVGASSGQGGLIRVRDVSRPAGFGDFTLNPLKGVVALFAADLIETLTRNLEADEALYSFVRKSIGYLAACSLHATANFHLALMAGIIRYAGVEPDLSTYHTGYLLDLQDGIFRATPPLHNDFLNQEESEAALKICRLTMGNCRFYRFNRSARNRIMDVMLNYISLHLRDVRSLKSVDVVRAL